MEITIKAQCPNCGKKMDLSLGNNRINFKDPNWFFDLTKNASLNGMANGPFFEDIFELIGKRLVKGKKDNKAIHFIKSYFKNLEFEIKNTEDKMGLIGIRRKVSK